MPELPFAWPEVAAPVVALLLYGALWMATRPLRGLARAMARGAPLVVVAGLAGFSLHLPTHAAGTAPAAVHGEAEGAPERVGVRRVRVKINKVQ
jgi:hypothetical protein